MKYNIKDKVDSLKDYIDNLNNKNISKEDLIYVEREFKKIYNDLVMFIININDRYYGYFILNLKLQVDFYKDIVSGITTLNKGNVVITINPLLFLNFTIKEMIYFICHEIEHLVLNHPSELLRMNPKLNPRKTKLLHIAMDCSINQNLKECIKYYYNNKYMSLPNYIIDIHTIKKITGLNNIKENESYLYYYNLIKDTKKELENIDYGISGETILNSGDIVTVNNSTKCGEFSYNFKQDYVYTKEITKDFINECYQNININTRGLLPAYQARALLNWFGPPKLNWKAILKQYLGNIPEPYKKTKMRLNRRNPLRYDLSGKTLDRTVKLVVAIDTSASMTNEYIKLVMNEIFNIVKNKKSEITIIECDCVINCIYKAKSSKDIRNKISGRGGTSFKPVIDYLNNNTYYRDSVLVYFTDGFGEKTIPKPNVYKVLWVVLGSVFNLSLKEPYGKVKQLEL